MIPPVYFAKAPNLSEMCTVTILVPDVEFQGVHVDTSFQSKVIRCRYLIFTDQHILATPLMNEDRKIQLITKKTYFEKGGLQQRLIKLGLELSPPQPVKMSQFESCLRYTLQAKISPLWNKCGEYFIQGRDFLLTNDKQLAVRCQITANRKDICFSIDAHVVKLGITELESLGIAPDRLQDFRVNGANAAINEDLIARSWCHIMPSMKKGQIVRVLKSLPKEGPLKTYKDVKKYWKNMYGYRLPETEDDLCYFQVYFRPLGSRFFTYPECCVRSNDVVLFNCPDKMTVAHQFLADVFSKIPSLCGDSFRVLQQPAFPINDLQPAMQVSQSDSVNVTKQIPNSKDQYAVNTSTPWKGVAPPKPWQPSLTKLNSSLISPGTSASGKGLSGVIPSQVAPQGSALSSCQKDSVPGRSQMQIDQVPSQFPHSRVDRSMGKIIPHFQAKASSIPSQVKVNANKVVPVFKKHRAMPSVDPSSLTNPTKSAVGTNELLKVTSLEPTAAGTSRIGLNNLAKCNFTEPTAKPTYALGLECEFVAPTQVPTKGMSLGDEVNQNMTNATVRPVFSTTKSKGFSHVSTPSFGRLERSTEELPALQWAKKPVFQGTSMPQGGMMSSNKPDTASFTANSKATVFKSANSTPVKRTADELPQDVLTPKRARSQPQVQENIDIISMLNSNKLDKVNTSTLSVWLKSHGIACKARDKKSELMGKVREYTQKNRPEV